MNDILTFEFNQVTMYVAVVTAWMEVRGGTYVSKWHWLCMGYHAETNNKKWITLRRSHHFVLFPFYKSNRDIVIGEQVEPGYCFAPDANAFLTSLGETSQTNTQH